jgi:hypothetical protein
MTYGLIYGLMFTIELLSKLRHFPGNDSTKLASTIFALAA